MKNYWRMLGLLLLWSMATSLFAQGPPITGDKPIMLGAKRWVFKTLSEYRQLSSRWALKAPIMLHYLPTSNTLLALHVPLVWYEGAQTAAPRLGDLSLVTKYQFYKKDGMGKTFRTVLKGVQQLPTGAPLELEGMSEGVFQSYWSIVAGYESIKYGIAGELGYNFNLLPNRSELRFKVGFGLPLLPPKYPVKQVNLFFEYQSSFWLAAQEYRLLYAQGIQYAKGRVTVEAAFQWPLAQQVVDIQHRLYSIFIGMRYVL